MNKPKFHNPTQHIIIVAYKNKWQNYVWYRSNFLFQGLSTPTWKKLLHQSVKTGFYIQYICCQVMTLWNQHTKTYNWNHEDNNHQRLLRERNNGYTVRFVDSIDTTQRKQQLFSDLHQSQRHRQFQRTSIWSETRKTSLNNGIVRRACESGDFVPHLLFWSIQPSWDFYINVLLWPLWNVGLQRGLKCYALLIGFIYKFDYIPQNHLMLAVKCYICIISSPY